MQDLTSIPTPSTSTLVPQLQPLPLPPLTFNSQNTCSNSSPIKIIPPGFKLPGLSPSELTLLHRKQTKLASTVTSTDHSLPNAPGLLHALASTLIFAQHEAGTAICIDPAGWILTCAHCFGDDETEYQADSRRRWLLFYTGLAVQVECRVWDPKRDLALLKIVAVETDGGKEGTNPRVSTRLPFVPSTGTEDANHLYRPTWS
ncbi:hypothetical protein HO173_005943 [Letharia columbiana]|uniref:Uncharacterized protein n=1 Tax=Letharia columbiana TaxID=112416 RepID=A0A8H6FW02_9LECA|nr:uncharacterized protein HO173_005943 [Letharia columbiana]KAF6235748.1 hypothetical protein HO173_005943 [Letharia columbiana]